HTTPFPLDFSKSLSIINLRLDIIAIMVLYRNYIIDCYAPNGYEIRNKKIRSCAPRTFSTDEVPSSIFRFLRG
ncbi:MAG: hypothetical protein V3U54_01020, partial [Thermodesulfobacteriota bacterium]